jgi:hypothetical protein
MENVMKKSLVSLLLVGLGLSNANAYGYHGFWGPAIVGGVIGYSLSRPYYPPVYVAPPPVYYQPPPVYYYQQQPQVHYTAPAPVCSAWTETQNSDGTVTKTRNCN